MSSDKLDPFREEWLANEEQLVKALNLDPLAKLLFQTLLKHIGQLLAEYTTLLRCTQAKEPYSSLIAAMRFYESVLRGTPIRLLTEQEIEATRDHIHVCKQRTEAPPL